MYYAISLESEVQVYYGDEMKLIGKFNIGSRNMRFSPDSTSLVIVDETAKTKFQIISLTPKLASGEEEIELSDVDDMVRQAYIVTINNETLVYILHGYYWRYTLHIYNSNKQKERLCIENIKSVCITLDKELEIYGTNSETMIIKRLSNHKEISKIDLKDRAQWMECFSDSRRVVVMGFEQIFCIDLYT